MAYTQEEINQAIIDLKMADPNASYDDIVGAAAQYGISQDQLDSSILNLNYTANTGYGRPVDDGGYTGYDAYGQNDLGLNVDRIYAGMEGNGQAGDAYMEQAVYDGYKSQLTTPDQDGKYLLAKYDDAGNLLGITEETRDTGGWFGENIDWLAPLMIGGFALAGSGALSALTGGAPVSGSTALSSSAVAAVEGSAGQVALSAYETAVAAGYPQSIALMAADTATALAGSGMTDAMIIQSAMETAASTAATGAVSATGEIVGGGGALTIDAGAGIPTASTLIDPFVPTPDGNFWDTPYVDAGDFGAPATGGSGTTYTPGGTGGSQAGGSGFNPLALLTGGLSILGAKNIYDKTAAMGPDMLSKYNALGADLKGQYGNISSGIRNDMGGLFDAAKQQGMDAYGAASQIDLNNLRQQEFDIMQAMFADPRAAQAASVEARQIAQGRGGLQSFNQANSAEFTDPTTGQTYTVGADPAMVAMYKAWANDDLNAYLQADKNALNRYSTLSNLGNQASGTALGIQDAWNKPLMAGLDAYGKLGAAGINAYGNAQFKANDAYANLVSGLMGGVQQATSGSGGTQLNSLLDKGANALYDYGKGAVSGLWDWVTG